MKFKYQDEVIINDDFYGNKKYSVVRTLNLFYFIRLYYIYDSIGDDPGYRKESKLSFADPNKEKAYQDSLFQKQFQKKVL